MSLLSSERLNSEFGLSKQNISLKDKNIVCRKCRVITIQGEKCWLCGWKND